MMKTKLFTLVFAVLVLGACKKEIKLDVKQIHLTDKTGQCVCSVLAILTAIGIYFGMREITGQEITGWLCVLGATPFAACGFFKYHGMTAEQFLWAVIKSELLYPKKLVFQSEDIHYSCMQETISLGEKNQKDGAEIIKEREQRAEAKQRKKRKGRSDAFD